MRLIVPILTLTAAAFAQRPRIFMVTELEGVGGVNNKDEQTTPGQRRFEESRRLLSAEGNAAVQGRPTTVLDCFQDWIK